MATNMAGRGTDIRLAPGVAEQGGLYVICTEFHESGRIDRQLSDAVAGRAIPVCASSFWLDDEIIATGLGEVAAKRLIASAVKRSPTSRVLLRHFEKAQRNVDAATKACCNSSWSRSNVARNCIRNWARTSISTWWIKSVSRDADRRRVTYPKKWFPRKSLENTH